MNKRDALEKMQQEWQALVGVAGRLPTRALEIAGTPATWSARDVLGHVAAWDAELVKVLDAMVSGAKPPSYGDFDQWNENSRASMASLPLAAMLVRMGESHQRLVSWLASVAEAKLQDPAVERRLRGESWEHYEEHRRYLESLA